MNKGELIAKIAEAGLSKKDAGIALVAAIAAIPRDSPLTVQFLQSFLAQLVLRDKSGHEHHLPSHGVLEV